MFQKNHSGWKVRIDCRRQEWKQDTKVGGSVRIQARGDDALDQSKGDEIRVRKHFEIRASRLYLGTQCEVVEKRSQG